MLYFLLLEDLSIFLIVFSGLFVCQMGSCPQYDRTSIGSSLFFKIKLPILGNELPK
jgi:predicted permease